MTCPNIFFSSADNDGISVVAAVSHIPSTYSARHKEHIEWPFAQVMLVATASRQTTQEAAIIIAFRRGRFASALRSSSGRTSHPIA